MVTGQITPHDEDDDEVYGQIEPTDALFQLDPPNVDTWSTAVALYVSSISNPQHDDIRTINTPGFDEMWDNTMENCWEANDEALTMDAARAWCLAAGMTESKEPLEVGG